MKEQNHVKLQTNPGENWQVVKISTRKYLT